MGSQVVMLTTDKQLLCVDGTGKLRWQVDLPYGPLAGAPLEAGGNFVLASTGGTVWRLNGNTGAEIAKVEIGQPLATGPVALGRHFLLGGHDGSLHRVELLDP